MHATVPGSLGLPGDHGFTYPADVLTPLGPRDRDWLRTAAAEPDVGRDFFAWWNPELNAAFYRGRALVARL